MALSYHDTLTKSHISVIVSGTIRELEAATIPSGAFPRGHYANWDTKPTTEVINKIYHEYNTLKYIPLRGIENDGGSLGEGDMVVSSAAIITTTTRLFAGFSFLTLLST